MSILRGHGGDTDHTYNEVLLEKRLRLMTDEIRCLREEKRRLIRDLDEITDDLARERRVRLHGVPKDSWLPRSSA